MKTDLPVPFYTMWFLDVGASCCVGKKPTDSESMQQGPNRKRKVNRCAQRDKGLN